MKMGMYMICGIKANELSNLVFLPIADASVYTLNIKISWFFVAYSYRLAGL